MIRSAQYIVQVRFKHANKYNFLITHRYINAPFRGLLQFRGFVGYSYCLGFSVYKASPYMRHDCRFLLFQNLFGLEVIYSYLQRTGSDPPHIDSKNYTNLYAYIHKIYKTAINFPYSLFDTRIEHTSVYFLFLHPCAEPLALFTYLFTFKEGY